MKNIVFTVFVLLSLIITTNAQNKDKPLFQKKDKTLFLRVHTLEGKRIKGNIHNINDSLLVLKKGKQEFSINSSAIKTVKTKHTGAANIIAGVGIGALIGGLIGYSEGSDEPGWFTVSKKDSAGILGVTGAVLGGGIGALTMTDRKKYRIDGDLEQWKLFMKSENLKK